MITIVSKLIGHGKHRKRESMDVNGIYLVYQITWEAY